MRIALTSADHNLARFGNAIAAIGDGHAQKAFARAVNRTATMVRTRVIRAVAKQSSIPQRIVRAQTRVIQARPGGGGAIEARIVATGARIPLREFDARQLSWGVRAKVWGSWQKFPGMFIYAGTYRSGQEVGNGHVFQRVTVASLPIEKQFGPSVPEEIVRGESAAAFYEVVDAVLPRRISHELGRLLP